MNFTSKNFQDSFMSQDPFKMGEYTNNIGQLIEFYEHPTRGDEACVYALIEGHLINTGFMDLDDMIADHGEYTPKIIYGNLYAGRYLVESNFKPLF